MDVFPAEFSELLSTTGARILAGDRSLLPADLAGSDESLFVLSDMFNEAAIERVTRIFERDFESRLGEIDAGIDPEWIVGMTSTNDELLEKTMRVQTVIFQDPTKDAYRVAERNGCLSMLCSDSMLRFAELATGYRLENNDRGAQLSLNRPGHYVGPHNDHHPSIDWARDGYVDLQFIFANDAVEHQWLVHQHGRHFSRVWSLCQRGAISVFKQPQWHYTTPMVAKAGREKDARRWLLGKVFRIVGRLDERPLEPPATLRGRPLDGLEKTIIARPPPAPLPERAPTNREAAPAAIEVQAPVALSHSALWQRQREYYEGRALRAWSEGQVPSQITTNPVIAAGYARLIESFVRDAGGAPSAPVTILELGAGSGRLAYLVLSELHERGALADRPVRYVMTDFNEKLVRAWTEHPRLKPLLASGKLSVARYDAERPNELPELQATGPSIVLANYFFDSIPADLFRSTGATPEEGAVRLLDHRGDPAGAAPSLDELRTETVYRPAPVPYYDDDELNEILAAYASLPVGQSFTLPVAGLRCVRALLAELAGPVLLVAADKACATLSEVATEGEPQLAHHGSVSLLTNMHALQLFTERRSGTALVSPQRRSTLSICAFAFGVPHRRLQATRDAFDGLARRSNPVDHKWVFGDVAPRYRVPVAQIMATLRMSHSDPWYFERYCDDLRAGIATMSLVMQEEVLSELALVASRSFPGHDRLDVPFEVAVAHQLAGYPQRALVFYDLSSALGGETADTAHNVGLCHYQLDDPTAALASFERALRLEPDRPQSVAWRERILAALAPEAREGAA